MTARGSGDVKPLVDRVVSILDEARSQVVRAVNSAMVLAYWHIGREIVEFVQGGAPRAEYGEELIQTLSARLREQVGRGHSASNLMYFQQFYQVYPNRSPEIRHEACGESAPRRIGHEARDESAAGLQGFSSNLSWTHYRTLLQVEDPRARAFYEIEAAQERWTTPHLERQIAHSRPALRKLAAILDGRDTRPYLKSLRKAVEASSIGTREQRDALLEGW